MKNSTIYKGVNGASKYRVGSDGTVWSFYPGRKREPNPRWKLLKTPADISKGGRSVVNITYDSGVTKTRPVGRLVLETFVGPPQEDQQCCHFPDPNPCNNSLDNLVWGTSKENNRHQYVHGTRVKGESHPQCRLSNEDVAAIRKLWDTHTQAEIAKMFSISSGYVSMLVNHKGRE